MGQQACCSSNEGGWCKSPSASKIADKGENSDIKVTGPVAPLGVDLQASLVPSSADERAAALTKADRVSSDDTSGTPDEAYERTEVAYEDGSRYIGQILNGQRHGRGVKESSSGSYDGEWLDDKPHGNGKQVWTDGRTFEGQFLHGKFEGTGKMVWDTQKGLLIYKGEYKADMKHGNGKFSWGDGRVYDGEWSNGMRHGRGKYTSGSGQTKIGYWIDDRFSHWETSADDKTVRP